MFSTFLSNRSRKSGGDQLLISGLLTFTLAVGLSLAVQAGDVARGGDDLGTLPGHGGSGVEDQMIDRRPAIYFEADSAAHLLAVVAEFEGEFALHEEDSDRGVRWVLYGEDYTIVLDKGVMKSFNVDMGVQTSMWTGDTLVRLSWPGVRTRGHLVPAEGSLDLDYQRLLETGLLDQSLELHMVTEHAEMHRLALSSGPGLLTLRRD